MGVFGSKYEPPTQTKVQKVSQYHNFNAIDKFAIEADAELVTQSPDDVQSTVPGLAFYLGKRYKSDLEKVRCFYRWITEHIKNAGLDYFEGGTLCCDPEAVLKKKSGVGEGYANLFLALCNYNGIPCRILSGFSKGQSYDPEFPFTEDSETDHVWNIVRIGREWHFIDCTWGAGYFTDWVFVKCYEEIYFLTDPEDFIREHFPYMNDNLEFSKQFQLLLKPWSLHTFNNQVKICSTGLEYGLRTLTHNEWNINVHREDTIEIGTARAQLVGVMAYLLKKGKELKGRVLVRRGPGDTFLINVRPPSTGVFVLSLLGRSATSGTVFSLLVSYIITCDEAGSFYLYPKDRHQQYGPGDHAEEFGLAPDARSLDIITAQQGHVDFTINLSQPMHAKFALRHAEKKIHDLKQRLKTSETEFFHRVQIDLPEYGYYTLSMSGKNPHKKAYEVVLTLLLENLPQRQKEYEFV